MIKKINIFLVLLLLLVCIGAVSAADDANSTVMSSDDTIDIAAPEGDNLLSSDAAGEELLASAVHVVNSSNYNNYFTSNGDLLPSSLNEGDTLQMDGSFSGKVFSFRKQVNVVGTSTNDMRECTFKLFEGASGSTISNLKITNTKDYTYGIFLDGAKNCTVRGCIINNTGQSSYAIGLGNNATYNNVSDNVLHTYGKTYGHLTRSTPPLLLTNAHHNYIGNNQIDCDDANGIYLSSYGGGPLEGGESTFNTIHNNVIKYNVLPTSWAYGIQVMGGNNIISSNTVIGGYRGISTTNPGNVIEGNWIINLTGADYNNPGQETGGEIAILGSYNSIIRNNHIINSKVISTGAGISALDNSVVENNYVEVFLQGKGVHPQGSNIEIKNNTIITNSGSGILYNSYSNNLKVLNNNISSNSGVGVLIQKISNKKMPGNITIVGNTISTSNKYAIDAAEANASSVNVIGPNNVKKGCEVRTPEGSYDPSKPAYTFNGTVHNINPSNYGDFINDNGGLSSDIKDGDILNFTGEFVNKNVIFINSAVKITGDNPVFYNTTFRVRCDGVWIENLVIRNNKADRVNAWGVVVYKVAGATVTNCDIDVVDPNAAYAIYVVESSDVDVIGNTLSSSGDYLTYTLLAYATEDCKFIDNTINTLGTGVVHKFEDQHCLDGDTNCLDGDTNCLDGDTNCLDGDTNCLDGDTNCLDGDTNCLDGDTNCLDGDTNSEGGSSIGNGNHVLSEVYRTYGILMAYSSGANVSGNKVNVTSKLNESVSPYNSTNSMVGIDSYFNCQNNIFADNEIYIKAYDNYIYGMGVLGYTTGHDAPEGQGAINNQFVNNHIVLDGTYFVTGIIIGDESTDTIIKDNIIDLKSDNVAYGITLEMSDKSSISDNYLTLNSDVIYGIEAFSSDGNEISNNELELNSKQVCGIRFSNSNDNSVISNIIFANGTGEKIDFKNFDSIAAENTGIFLKSNSTENEIKKNMITSITGYAILVDDLAINNIITENCLDSEKGIGNGAVNNTKNNVVENNYRYTFTGKMPSMKVNYLENATIVLNIDDGANVTFYIGNDEIGSGTSSNGAATLNYKFEDPYVPGNYKIRAIATKENYLTKEFSATLKVNKANVNVDLEDVSAKKLADGTFIATVSDVSGSPVSGLNVKFYRIQGRYVYMGEATTDEKGVAKLVAQIPSLSDNSYVISANVTADSKFNAASDEAFLNILNDNSIEIGLKNIEVVYNDGQNLVATLKDTKGHAVGGINVDVQLNGANSTETSDKDGKVVISLAGLVPDTYTAKVVFSGNELYKGSSASAKVTVNKIGTELTADGTAVTLKDDGGNPIGDAKVTVQINGANSTLTTDKDGKTTIPTSQLTPETYFVDITFAGNDFYKASSTTSKIVINQIATTLTADNVVTDYNGGKKLVAILKDEDGKAIGGANVTVKLGNVTEVLTTDANGQVSLSTDGFVPRTYAATITFDGDVVYKKSSASASVTVNKLVTVLTARYDGASKNIVATVKDANGNAVRGIEVGFDIDGVEYVVTDANGQAKYSTSDFADMAYSIGVMAYGNEIYNDSNKETVEFDLSKIATVLTADDVVTDYNGGKKLVATLKDVDGKVIGGANVTVKLGNVTEVLTTDANGQVSQTTDGFVPNNYTATITYGGDDIYDKSSASALVTINKLVTVLTADNVVTDYNGGKKLVATLKDVDGKVIGGANVTVKLGNVTEVLTTDANGQVSRTTDGFVPNNYTATITYGGDDIYDKSSASASVTINKLVTVLTARYDGASKNIVATVKDANGNAVSGIEVGFDIDGVEYVVTDADGQANYSTSGLDYKKYDVNVIAHANWLYKDSNMETVEFDLTRISTTWNVTDVTTVYNGGKKLVATLKDSNGNVISGAKVTVKLGDVIKNLTTDAKGQVSLSLDGIIPNTYAATVAFGGDDIYNASSASAKVTVTKEQSKIFLRNALYFVLQTKMVKVTLWDANNKPLAGKTVYIKLDQYDWKYYGVTDENGTATIKVGVGFGIHGATVGFEGDENYTATSKTGSVRVIKETPSLMLPGAYTMFKATQKTKTVKIYLKDRYDKPLLPGTKVFIKVNGQTYAGLIDINGIATINLNINRAGSYNAELIYMGNTAYNPVRKSTKIRIV